MYKIRENPTLYPEGQAIIEERTLKIRRRNHRKAVRNQKCIIDRRCPRDFPKRIKNPYNVISRIRDTNSQNRKFIDRLITTPKNPALVLTKKHTEIKSLNHRQRMNILKQVHRENKDMEKRLRNVNSVLDHNILKPKHREDTLRIRLENRGLFIKSPASRKQLKRARSAGTLLHTTNRLESPFTEKTDDELVKSEFNDQDNIVGVVQTEMAEKKRYNVSITP